MEGLPVVRKGETIEEWLGRAVPALLNMTQLGLDEATAKDLATQAWNTVNGTKPADETSAPAAEDEGWPDAEMAADDPFAAGAEEEDPEDPDLTKGEDEEDLLDAEMAADDPFAAGTEGGEAGDPKLDKEKTSEPDLAKGEDEEDLTEADALPDWEDEDTWGEGLLDGPMADKLPEKADEPAADQEPPTDEPAAEPPASADPKPNKPIIASGETLTWFHEQMANASAAITGALASNGNIKPEEADLLDAELRRLLDKLLPAPTTAPGSATKAATMITYLEAMIHRDFTNLADTLREQGNLTRSERIALSNCVGDMLSTFIDTVKQNLGPSFMHRSPFIDVEQYASDDRKPAPVNAAPPAAGDQMAPTTPDETPATKDSVGSDAPPTDASKPGELTLTITLPPVEPDLYTKSLQGDFTFRSISDDASQKSSAGGFAILPLPERGVTLPVGGLNAKAVADFVTRNADAWHMPGATLGGWSDPTSGVTRLDIAMPVKSEAEAIELARRYEQTHYLNLATGKAMAVPSKSAALDLETLRSIWIATKGFIGPSFRAKHRLDDDPVDLLTVKSIGRERAGGYLCLWGDKDHKDLSGEFFTPNTQELTSIFEAMGGVPAIYHHAFDDVLKSMVVGVIDTMKRDDVGLWVEDQIRMADEYQKYIQPLVAKRRLGWSSGTLPGARRVNKATGEILRWPIVEGSKTYSPAEWRMAAKWPIEPLKAAYIQAGIGGDIDRLYKRSAISKANLTALLAGTDAQSG